MFFGMSLIVYDLEGDDVHKAVSCNTESLQGKFSAPFSCGIVICGRGKHASAPLDIRGSASPPVLCPLQMKNSRLRAL